jgi:hypothetical protein
MGMALFLLALIHSGVSFARDTKTDSYPPEWTHGKTYCPLGKTEEKRNGLFLTSRNSGALRLWDSFHWVDLNLRSLQESTCFPGGVALADKLKPLADSLRGELREGVQASACEQSGSTAESRAMLAKELPEKIQAAEKWVESALDESVTKSALNSSIDDECFKAAGMAMEDLPMAMEMLSCELLVTRNRLALLNEMYDKGNAAAYICADDPAPAKLDPSVDDRGIPKSDITGLGTH